MEFWLKIIIGIIIMVIIYIVFIKNWDRDNDNFEGEINIFKRGFNKCCKKLGRAMGI